MTGLEIDPSSMDVAAGRIDPLKPFVMLNLLRFRDVAAYADGRSDPPCSGRDAYFGRYVPAFGRVAANDAIRPIWLGGVAAGLVTPPDEAWDVVVLVHYPTFQAFRDVVESRSYLSEAAPHRLASLADWRLVANVEWPLPESRGGGAQR